MKIQTSTLHTVRPLPVEILQVLKIAMHIVYSLFKGYHVYLAEGRVLEMYALHTDYHIINPPITLYVTLQASRQLWKEWSGLLGASHSCSPEDNEEEGKAVSGLNIP